MTDFAAPGGLLRFAELGDAELVFRWRNDPWIISLGASGKTVSWEEHIAWFRSVLDHSRHLLFIIQQNGTPVGTLRLDRDGDEASMSIYLLERYTGMGLGTAAIDEACGFAFDCWTSLERIVAFVRPNNERSLKSFSRNRFHQVYHDINIPEGCLALVRTRQ